MPDPDAWRETWDGARISADAAVEVFGADEALPLSRVSRLSFSHCWQAFGRLIATLDRPSIPVACNAMTLPCQQTKGRCTDQEGGATARSQAQLVHLAGAPAAASGAGAAI